MDVNTYIELVKAEFIYFLKGHEMNTDLNVLMQEKKQHVTIYLYSLKKKLDTLKLREKELEQEYTFQSEKLDKLLSAKLKEQSRIGKRYY